MSAHIINDPADLLEAAANEIDAHGWNQGSYRNKNGNLCAMGAIFTALWGENVNDWYKYPLYHPNVIGLEYMNPVMNIIETYAGTDVADWNDSQCKTTATVTNTLRQLAKAYREKNNSELQ